MQLHGEESVESCQRLRQEFPHCRLIKALRVKNEDDGARLAPYNDVVDGFLLDTYVRGAKGGTGEIFDWSIIEKLQLQRPFLLAGGLTPDNVEQALLEVQPYGLDVNSGVEVGPGVKDHNLLCTLMQRVAQS